MKMDMVSFVSIKDAGGNLIFSDEKPGTNNHSAQRTDISFREKHIGSFELAWSDDDFEGHQQIWILSGIVNSLIIIIGIMFSVIFFYKSVSSKAVI